MQRARVLLASIVIISTNVCVVQTSDAATWVPISMVVDPAGSSPQVFNYSLNNFTDNVYNQNNYILTDNINPPVYNGPNRTTITFFSGAAPGVSAPFVDVNAHTIDVSSIYAEGWTANYDCAVTPSTCDPRFPKLGWYGVIGWDFGPQTPVPYVVNSDGTFTATWNATNSRGSLFNGFGNAPISLTFSAVPVPAAFWLLGSGLIGFLGFLRRRRR